MRVYTPDPLTFIDKHLSITQYSLFQESGLYQYKVYGKLDVPVETCVKVYMDLDYRRTWDSYVKGDILWYNQLFFVMGGDQSFG